jgi:tRNA 2-thiouridine synthesizing protein A
MASDPLRHELDLCGLKCPLPAIKTRKALAALPANAILTVTATDPMAAIDIPHLVQELGYFLQAQAQEETLLRFTIVKIKEG